jgi:hypothetical protein
MMFFWPWLWWIAVLGPQRQPTPYTVEELDGGCKLIRFERRR